MLGGHHSPQTEELRLVRWQLERLVEQRRLVPLSDAEQQRYHRLALRERTLLNGDG